MSACYLRFRKNQGLAVAMGLKCYTSLTQSAAADLARYTCVAKTNSKLVETDAQKMKRVCDKLATLEDGIVRAAIAKYRFWLLEQK